MGFSVSARYLYRLPGGEYADYVEAACILPVGSTVYIAEDANEKDIKHGPYRVSSIDSDIKCFRNWTAQVVWIHLDKIKT